MGILRFLLALAVAGGHIYANFNLPHIFLSGGTAVQIFYVISGFLIALILRGKYADTASGNWIFYSNRLLKIFVPYAVILSATVLLCLLFYAFTGNAVSLDPYFREASFMTAPTWLYAIFTNLFIVGQEWGYLLIYRAGSLFFSLHAFDQPPLALQFSIIVPAWSLSVELLFYAVAPLILRRHLLVVVLIAYASYWLRFEAYHAGYYSAGTDCRFFPFELSLFLLGSLSHSWYQFLKERDLFRPALSVVLTAVAAILVFAHPRWVDVKPYQFYCLLGVLMPALFDFDKTYRWDRILGEISYPLYLVHWPVLMLGSAMAAQLRISNSEISPAFAGFLLVVSIALSVAINRYIVQPLDTWRQARVREPIVSSTTPNTMPVLASMTAAAPPTAPQ